MGATFTPLAVPGLALSILCHAVGMPMPGSLITPQSSGVNGSSLHASAPRTNATHSVPSPSAAAFKAPRMVVRDFTQTTARQSAPSQPTLRTIAQAAPAFVVPAVVQEDPTFFAPLKPAPSAAVPAPALADIPVPQAEPEPSGSYEIKPADPAASDGGDAGDWQNSSAALEQQELALFVMVNRERQSRGLQPLALSPLLCQVARAHSEDMCRRNYFDHIAPLPGPASPLDRYLAAVGHRPDRAMLGENIYYRSVTDSISSYAAQSHDAFMHSPGHRANILTPQYDQGGIGIYRNPATGEFWVTEEFLTVSPYKL